MELQIFYIYKTINLNNGKFYVGKHTASSLDNDYLGSGKLLQRAIQKYGHQNFKKEILGVFDHEWQMNLAERIYVVLDPQSYNICPGGKGGFGYINKKGLNPRWDSNKSKKVRSLRKDYTKAKFQPEALESLKRKYPFGTMFGKTHSLKTREKMRKSKLKPNGRMWITDGVNNKQISKLDEISGNFRKGRIITKL